MNKILCPAREKLALLLTLMLLIPCGGSAAEAWPAREVTLIVAQAPGSSADNTARVVAAELSLTWGKPVVVENKAGADGLIGIGFVAKAAPDGYTIGYAAPSNMTVNQFIYKKMPYQPLKDFAAITQMTDIPFALVVNPKLPVRTVQDLVALAKEHPGKLNFSSAGIGNVGHLAAELLSEKAGIKMQHIPHKGDSPGLMDVASGTTDLMLLPLPGAAPTIRSGLVRLIAIAGRTRVPAFPDVPTMQESGYPDVVVEGWSGLIAPAGTPGNIVQKIQQDTARALGTARAKAYLDSNGSVPVGSSPQAFSKFLADESRKWSEVITRIGLANSH